MIFRATLPDGQWCLLSDKQKVRARVVIGDQRLPRRRSIRCVVAGLLSRLFFGGQYRITNSELDNHLIFSVQELQK
jgi:hypothetical protein